MKKTFALIDSSAAFDVAAFVERNLDNACPIASRAAWQVVADGLYALSNDTDFMVTDAAVVPDMETVPHALHSLGMMTPTNADRAEFAQAAVSAFQGVCRTDDEDAIGDLLCNMAHLIRRQGGDPKAMFRSALAMNAEEVAEDDEGDDEQDPAPENPIYVAAAKAAGWYWETEQSEWRKTDATASDGYRYASTAEHACQAERKAARESGWTADDMHAAGVQGWFMAGGIERVDDMHEFCPEGDGEPIFASDDDARIHVEAQAAKGDALAVKALAFIASL